NEVLRRLFRFSQNSNWSLRRFSSRMMLTSWKSITHTCRCLYAPITLPKNRSLDNWLYNSSGMGTTSERWWAISVSSAVDEKAPSRSEEHTSELQSRENLVCRLLLEKKNIVDSDD